MTLSMIGFHYRFQLAALAVIGFSGIAGAHGTGYTLLQDTPAAAAEFYYSDQTPMAYAEVLVYSPLDKKIEHQNGRTDKNGKFVFCPDTVGQWHVTVNDGMGHAVEATVPVAALSGTTEAPQRRPGAGDAAPSSTILKIIAGLSLILNVFFAANAVNRRSK